MNASDLAFWLCEEHLELARSVELLQEKIAVVTSTNEQRWLDEVRKEFEHFRIHVNKHQSLEERDGYMVNVVEQQPALNTEVTRLAHEHGEFKHLMDGIRTELKGVLPDDKVLIRDCCHRIQNLLQYIQHHEKDENLLVISTCGQDFGTGD
jgi:hemerythrin-like domain-containing protein